MIVGSVSRDGSNRHICERGMVLGKVNVMETGWWSERNIASMDGCLSMGKSFCDMNM